MVGVDPDLMAEANPMGGAKPAVSLPKVGPPLALALVSLPKLGGKAPQRIRLGFRSPHPQLLVRRFIGLHLYSW